jgi:hypothetical protein
MSRLLKTKHGYAGYQFEDRLSLGKIEVKGSAPSRRAAGKERLAVLQSAASRKVFLLMPRKAASASEQQFHNLINLLEPHLGSHRGAYLNMGFGIL